MLHDFITTNKTALIRRCKAKAANRYSPSKIPAEVNSGVPLFLEQLVAALQLAEVEGGIIIYPKEVPKLSDIIRTAAIHGAELLRTGYSIEQVVHDYGDVCQSITEMAIEQNIKFSTDDFRLLNSNLDDAIAESVRVYGNGLQNTMKSNNSDNLNLRQNTALEQLRFIEMAIRAHEAIKTAAIGVAGSTGELLIYALDELKKLTEKDLAETRTALGETKSNQILG